MPWVTLPNGKRVLFALRMAEFRELWQSGAIQALQNLEKSGDLAAAYPVLAKTAKAWDLTDLEGQPLDPTLEASYDELEPSAFLWLLKAVGAYISGEETKN